MPGQTKIKGFRRKWLIKQMAGKYLPNSIINRRKVGFAVPLSQWFRGKLKEMCYDRICERNGLTRQFLRKAQLEKILDDHCSNRKDNALKIWTLLGLSIWNDVFCKNRMDGYELEETFCRTR